MHSFSEPRLISSMRMSRSFVSKRRTRSDSWRMAMNSWPKKSKIRSAVSRTGERLLPRARRLPISKAAAISIDLAGPMPLAWRRISLGVQRESWAKPPQSLSRSRATASAFFPGMPVRMKIASNSASESASKPWRSAFSRGRSSMGIS